jgi:hypothetical protein
MLEPPRALDAAAVLSNKKKASKELHNKLESVNSEIMAMEARMRKRKAWTRLEEVKEEEAALLAETHEAAQREAERLAKVEQRKAAAAAAAAVHVAAAQAEEPPREVKREVEHHETSTEGCTEDMLARLEARANSGESPATKGQQSILTPPDVTSEGAGFLGGILGSVSSLVHELAAVGTIGTIGTIASAAAVPVSTGAQTPEEELAELRAQYKAADKKVHDLRCTGGVALQDAYAEFKALKLKYRAMRDQVEGARKETPVAHKSAAGQTSARRLERQREREAARKKTVGERPAWQ